MTSFVHLDGAAAAAAAARRRCWMCCVSTAVVCQLTGAMAKTSTLAGCMEDRRVIAPTCSASSRSGRLPVCAARTAMYERLISDSGLPVSETQQRQ